MKSTKKQVIIVFAILTMAIILSCAFVACDKVESDKTGTDIVSEYKVTIHPNNGQGDIVWDITKAIPTITKDGFHIAGYFLDAQLTISTTLESLKATGITKNIDVYVKWAEDVCEHVEVTDNAVEPTCTEKGLTEGTHCSKCGKILQAQNEIPALGHDLEHHDGKEATCTEKGWKEYDTCKREGCDHTTYEEIPALGHTGGTATCTEQATCSVCGEKYGDALGHTGGTATCTEQAICERCGNKYGESLGHDYKSIVTDPTCTKQGYTTHTCTHCKHSYIDTYIDALGHKETIDEAVEPTCTTAGLTAGKHCSVCGEVLQAQNEIPALGHDFSNEWTIDKEATCTEKGSKSHHCTRCEVKSDVTEIPTIEHSESDWIIDKEATCTEDGSKHTECTVCHTTIKTEKISALGHTGGTATCAEQAICERCGNKYGELAEHDYKNGVCIVCGIRRPSEGLKYSLNSDGNGYTVTGIGTCTDKELIIPSEYNAKPVTSIGDSAFYNCTRLTSITIPNSVTSIGGWAFRGCTGLTSVTIPNGVTSIGGSAFEGCTGLTNITIPDSVTSIGGAAFHGTAWYNNQPDGLVYAGKVAYKYKGTMPSNTSIVLKEGTLGITDSAFYKCTGLTSITIPDSVTSIGGMAFNGCTGLTSVTIPDSVTSIGSSAFGGCNKLQDIYITDIAAWCNISGLDNLMEYGASNKKLYINNELATSITIPNGVMAIPSYAFEDCTGLTSITIPDSVTSISAGAFSGCSGLTSVTIPDSVTSIGRSAFDGCKGLTNVTIPDSVTSIDYYAFYNCTGLTSIKFNGTKAQWNAISKGKYWKDRVPSSCKVICTDGTISI